MDKGKGKIDLSSWPYGDHTFMFAISMHSFRWDSFNYQDADGDGIITADELIAINEDNFNADAVIDEFTLRVENIEVR